MDKKINSQRLKKAKMGKPYLLFIALLFFVACLFIIIFGHSYVKRDNTEYLYAIKKENYKTKLEITQEPILFAKEDNDSKNGYYFVIDDNNYLYIVYMSEDKYLEIKEIDNIKDNHYTLIGTSIKITDEVKDIALSICKEELNYEDINSDNFSNFFGDYAMDLVSNINNAKKSGIRLRYFYLTGFLFFLAFLGSLWAFIRSRINTKNLLNSLTDKELEKLALEIDDKKTKDYGKKGLFLTENYIVSLINGLDIIPYSNIVWLYKHEVKSYGILVINRDIIIYTKDKIKHVILGNIKLRKKDKELYNEIFDYIVSKNPKALVGYNDEIKEKAYEKLSK